MCGFTLESHVYFAIAVVVILAFIAILRYLFIGPPQPGQPVFSFNWGANTFIINTVIGVAITVCVLLFILHVAQCVGAGGGRYGRLDDLSHLSLWFPKLKIAILPVVG